MKGEPSGSVAFCSIKRLMVTAVMSFELEAMAQYVCLSQRVSGDAYAVTQLTFSSTGTPDLVLIPIGMISSPSGELTASIPPGICDALKSA